jgi:hypothetical protein
MQNSKDISYKFNVDTNIIVFIVILQLFLLLPIIISLANVFCRYVNIFSSKRWQYQIS